ncbi:eIF-2-alpha kinase GCN2 [Citrus sinensis]|nr:eIF-2-alpha kinase GCN2 [Citrus sinensis]
MGKKKKGGGSGRRSKGRAQSKDHSSSTVDDNELLSEEITALCAIFQEDCKVVSGSPPQILVKLRPYSKDMGYEDLDVSALLLVRCLPGYPYKCPKLQITLEKGLTKSDADNLLCLLQDQANSNAREGRVMIFNLVEAAQEFLSEIVPLGQSNESVPGLVTESSSQSFEGSAVSASKSCSSKVPFVYGFIDLFSGCGESWHWGLGIDENRGVVPSVPSHASDGSNYEVMRRKIDKNVKPLMIPDANQGTALIPSAKLDTVKEENEDDNRSISTTDSSTSPMEEWVENGIKGENRDSLLQDHGSNNDGGDTEIDRLESFSFASLGQDQASQDIEKDLILVHLLRLACQSTGSLTDALPQIATELYNLGVSSRVSQFWKPSVDSGGPNMSLPSSRYLNDFEELQPLGHGGFGHVVLCKNKLDGRHYAVKKIRLKDKSLPVNDRILREVATLSRLQHQHVVRYYQAWFETGVADFDGDSMWGSGTVASSTFSNRAASSADVIGQENKLESTYLYIQMEYCPRDLTPNNIFFDARNDIKIGDFGLAKFLKLEQLDQDAAFPTDTGGVSVDGTGQVGTYFYTAPEIEQGWPKIDEKADMYSLGIVFFELWHPFSTAMERQIVLSDLKQKGELPPSWVAKFSEQESLLRRLMSPSPSDRPSATELLQDALPPQMEYELLDNILRMMHSSEDTSIYDKVVSSLFDEETLDMKHHAGTLRLNRDNTSSIQYSDLDTELRDYVVQVTKEMFRQHCAKHLEIEPMYLLGDCPQFKRNTVKLLTHGGDLLELSHELRLPFIRWAISNQKSSFKRYEISSVYRRAIGHSPPNRYLQGDFDIIGGASALTEAEVLKVTMDIVTRFFHAESCDIHLNHGDLLEAIWSWAGIKAEHREKVAELLSMMGSLRPQSSEWKSKWVVIRRQLLQELNLAEAVVNRLQTVGLRFCGSADQALPRLRGALPTDKPTRKALDELYDLFSYLRIWRIEKNIYIDALMPPIESYHRNLFFQVFSVKEKYPATLVEGTLLAVGGRYDYLLHRMWDREYVGYAPRTNPPSGVGASLALETIIQHYPVDFKPVRNEAGTSVLVCSRGGGGLLVERMELVAELWEENIKAQFVPVPDPSLTEQYEYASEHDIKCLVILTDTGAQKGLVKVRHLDVKKEKEVQRESLVRFLLDAIASQFRNPSLWS